MTRSYPGYILPESGIYNLIFSHHLSHVRSDFKLSVILSVFAPMLPGWLAAPIALKAYVRIV